MARPAYLATIAARARGTAAALVPPSVPMRGWDGAWPAELPPAAVVKPAMPASSSLEPVVRVRSSEPAVRAEPPELGDPDTGGATSAAGDRVGSSVSLRARSSLPVEPAIASDPRDAPASIAHDASARPPVERLASPSHVAPPANPLRAGERVPRVERAAIAPSRTAAPGGMPEPLRAGPHAERAMDREADRARSISAPASTRLSPAAALHAALQWVSAPAAEPPSSMVASDPARDGSRMAPAARAELPAPRPAPRPIDERPGAGAHAPAARRDAPPPVMPAPDRKPAPRTLHIGSIEVEIQAPRDADRDARSVQTAPASPAAPLARGFTTPLGLRQG